MRVHTPGPGPGRNQSLRGVSVLCLVGLALAVGVPAAMANDSTPAEAEGTLAWTDEQIEAAVESGCDSSHKIRRYRGAGARTFDILGPLYLVDGGDVRPRGVVLPTYLRLFLYGYHRRCRGVSLEEARTLAGPETWVVLWRAEDPYRGRSRMTSSDQRVLTPTEVRVRRDNQWHEPVETRQTDRWIRTWFGDDWNEEESLLAVFDELPYAGSLFVDYDVEEGGSSYLTDSSIFGLTSYQKKWWALAHGEPEPKGGSWWKR